MRKYNVPGWIHFIQKNKQDEEEKKHDTLIALAASEEKKWRTELKAIKADIREWVESEEMQEFGAAARNRYLKQQEMLLLTMFRDNKARYMELMQEDPKHWEIPFLIEEAEKLARQLKRYQIQRAGKTGAVTEHMIEAAKEYPIEEIVHKESNGRAKCCFHKGEDPNMDIRKNYAFCYVCGKSGSTIDVYRAIYGVGFKQAVQALCGVRATV